MAVGARPASEPSEESSVFDLIYVLLTLGGFAVVGAALEGALRL